MPAPRPAPNAASEALAEARKVIEERIAELAPLVEEHAHLSSVLRAMDPSAAKPKRTYTRRSPARPATPNATT